MSLLAKMKHGYLVLLMMGLSPLVFAQQITVTQEDIDQGLRQTPTGCAIARAIKRQTGFSAVVYPYDIYVTGKDISYHQETSGEIQDFIVKWDVHYPVKPFSFELNVQGN